MAIQFASFRALTIPLDWQLCCCCCSRRTTKFLSLSSTALLPTTYIHRLVSSERGELYWFALARCLLFSFSIRNSYSGVHTDWLVWMRIGVLFCGAWPRVARKLDSVGAETGRLMSASCWNVLRYARKRMPNELDGSSVASWWSLPLPVRNETVPVGNFLQVT